MRRAVLYVAAPLRPTEEEIDAIPNFTVERGRGEYEPDMKIFVSREARVHPALRANLDRAMRWLAWLRRSFPETTFIAPWIASVLAGADDADDADDADPAQREVGMLDACAVVERCDGIVLCGGRISSGMRREMEHGLRRGLDDSCEPHIQTFEVYDLVTSCPVPEGPSTPARPWIAFKDWARRIR